MIEQSQFDKLLQEANDYEVGVIIDVAIRAGIMWKCNKCMYQMMMDEPHCHCPRPEQK